ncbi:MAG: hypothetical protein NC908_01415 [Candidatus Omnitrophica bacterium]|nr:hypothetical protein [Candidatus Omnitrophota bacterium]
MSLESIIQHILKQASFESQQIIQQAKAQAERIIQEAEQKASQLYQQIIEREQRLALAEKDRLIVNARISAKKKILAAKRELMDAAFQRLRPYIQKDKLKKQVILSDRIQESQEDIDFYLRRLRIEYESELAKVLFV